MIRGKVQRVREVPCASIYHREEPENIMELLRRREIAGIAWNRLAKQFSGSGAP
jgi:hypothetical protein